VTNSFQRRPPCGAPRQICCDAPLGGAADILECEDLSRDRPISKGEQDDRTVSDVKVRGANVGDDVGSVSQEGESEEVAGRSRGSALAEAGLRRELAARASDATDCRAEVERSIGGEGRTRGLEEIKCCGHRTLEGYALGGHITVSEVEHKGGLAGERSRRNEES